MKKIEILNYEGPILSAQYKSKGRARIFDQWGVQVDLINKQEMIRFLNGEFSIVDSKKREWNYRDADNDAKTHADKILEIFEQ